MRHLNFEFAKGLRSDINDVRWVEPDDERLDRYCRAHGIHKSDSPKDNFTKADMDAEQEWFASVCLTHKYREIKYCKKIRRIMDEDRKNRHQWQSGRDSLRI